MKLKENKHLKLNELIEVLKLNYQRINESNYEEFLKGVLNLETSERNDNSIQRKIKEAHFPYKFTLSDFKRDHLSQEIKSKIKVLETLDFINNGENIILIGNPGTGKTALSLALGVAACMENKRVLFISVPQLIIEINEAMSKSQYLRYQ